ncbi:hypothetical protein D869_gp262 [Caulobacter phage CcrRogue]|uniref:Uncharacterized protein n=1 Tax=Caulobacter phage CcrRogue TaxID=2927986 RepID=K4K351_9CAUD|nr:hypothetical protein D869_gp262 [Caulobacter phage CcrRogue]AFU86652.1 hypothetical protein CcrRogue_gp170 [Caulobacter phage CcrRogue]
MYFLTALFICAGVWAAAATVFPAVFRKLGITNYEGIGVYCFFFGIAGIIIGLIWPLALFLGFWAGVFFFVRKKLGALAEKAVDAVDNASTK